MQRSLVVQPEEVAVPRYQDSRSRVCKGQLFRIALPRQAAVNGFRDVDSAPSQFPSDSGVDVFVQTEP